MRINPIDESGSFFVWVNSGEQRGLSPASADTPTGWLADYGEADDTAFLDFIADDWPHIRPDLLEGLKGAGLSIRKP
jgi:uncharacterized protein YbdZ (MbtH family)